LKKITEALGTLKDELRLPETKNGDATPQESTADL
jgi:hypothetical protein